jgi:Cu(I)/Ag(I) efflux system membrane fusion protein
MKLVSQTKGSQPPPSNEDTVDQHAGEARDGPAGVLTVAGRATISIPPETRRLLGIRKEAVRTMRLVRQIRSVGRVTADERRLRRVYARCEGFVERVYADSVGGRVRKGEPLASLTCRGAPAATQVRAPAIGSVLQKKVSAGMRVSPGDLLYEIADLSRVWVLAELYESDLPSIQVGMEAGLTVLSFPGKSWRGRLAIIAPTVESKARTITIRIDLANPGDELRPNMFADVFLRRDLGPGLMVPDTAVILAGNRRLVFVDHEDGWLEPRELRLGANLGSGFQVLSGLAEGERVVTSANFLIDSESSLKGAIASPPAKSTAAIGNGR